MRIALLVALPTFTLAAHGCAGPEEPPPVAEAAAVLSPIRMPIEVMPMDAASLTGTFIESRNLPLDAAAARTLAGGSLYLRGHGLSYRDGSSLAHKAEVRWDGGAWIPLVNPIAAGPSDLVIDGLDAIHGGIGGGFRTVGLRIPFERLCGSPTCVTAGTHTIDFHWMGTDGTASGYRIVELNLRAAGTPDVDLLPPAAFAVDDPATWQPPLPAPADVAEGERLFYQRRLLTTRPGAAGLPMIASCSDCHAHDGRDLEYYGYSNRSIENRSIFHGLTPTQGQQIASYVRSNPSPRRGRPWNPPYQPAIGRDALGAGWWAAGAGLDAVQPETAALMDQLFPDGLTDQQLMADNIRGIATTPLPAQTTNLRELPIAIQLPDWNSWLPEVHPVDLWGACSWDAGDGSFESALAIDAATLSSASGLATDDLDGDTRLDVIAALPLANRLWVMRGDDGGLAPPVTVYMGTRPVAVATADLTGDGIVELIAANQGSNDITVRPGDGTGGFGAAATRASGSGPRALATGDWNNDGLLDVAVALFAADRIAVHLGAGTPLVGPAITRPAGDGPVDLVAAEMNGDGNLDLVVVSSLTDQVLVLPGLGNGLFGAATALAVGASPQAVAIDDLDGDGQLDLVVANQNGPSVSVIRRRAAGGFQPAVTIALAAAPADIALADLDDDLDLDAVVTIGGTADEVVVLLGDGAGGFAGQSSSPVDDEPRSLLVADFDLDGADDAIVASATLPQLTMVPARRCIDPAIAPSVVQAYQRARAGLTVLDRSDTAAVEALPYLIGPVAGNGRAFVEGGLTLSNGDGDASAFRTTRGIVLDGAVVRGYSMELVKRSLAQWLAVKQWELMQEYELETLGPIVFGADGEALSWPMGAHQSVFQIAPHILSADRNDFDDPATYAIEHDACRDPLYLGEPGCVAPMHVAQTGQKGDYDSTAWYHLQMLLNGGARSLHEAVPLGTLESAVQPVDWPYALMHVDDVGQRAADVAALIPAAPRGWEPIRYLATMMKAYQMRDNGKGPAGIGWSMRDVSPRLLVSSWRGQAEDIDLLTELDVVGGVGTRAAVASAFLLAFEQVVADPDFTPAAWARFDDGVAVGGGTWWKLDPSTHVAVDPVGDTEFPSGTFSHANDMWNAIPMLSAIPGIDAARVAWLRTWSASMWTDPANDWASR